MATWNSHLYLKEGRRRGVSPQNLERYVKEGLRLQGLGLPVVFNLEHLASILELKENYLRKIVKREVDPYRAFKISKRSGGYRIITVPSENLLTVQRWIHQFILINQLVHSSSTAFAPKCSPFKNASVHCGANWLVKLDISAFFEAISERQVYHVFSGVNPDFLDTV